MKAFDKVKLKKIFHNYDWKIMVKIITFIVLLFLILLDQLVKFWVKKKLPLDIEYSFMPGFINLKHVINKGSAFGLNQNKTTLLITLGMLIAFGLLIWWTFSRSTTIIVALTFILAGTIGNLIDRFTNDGGVIDFLKWSLFPPYSIFNIADIMVTVGVIIIIVYLVVETVKTSMNDRKEKKGHKKIDEKQRKAV